MNAREPIWRSLTLLLLGIQGFDSCNVFTSALELSTFIFISYFIHLSIDFLRLTPRGCVTASVGEYVPNFFPLGFWVFVSGGARE